MGQCDNQTGLVDVCGEYACFFRQVAGTPYDVVAPWCDGGYICRTVGIYADVYVVANRHWIGGAYPFQPEIAFYAAVYFAPVCQQYPEVAAGVLNDHSGVALNCD